MSTHLRSHYHGLHSFRLGQSSNVYRLWKSCAVPGFLYGTEAMVFSKTTLQELEKIQHLVSSFILQLPESSSQVMGWMEAGLQPIQQRLDTRTVLFAHDLMTRKKDYFSYWYGSDIPVGGLGCPRWGFLQISSHISHILE